MKLSIIVPLLLQYACLVSSEEICEDKKLGNMSETCDSLMGDDEDLRQAWCGTKAWLRKKCLKTCGLCCEDNADFKFKSVNHKTGEKTRRSCNWLTKGDASKRRLDYCGKSFGGTKIKDAW